MFIIALLFAARSLASLYSVGSHSVFQTSRSSKHTLSVSYPESQLSEAESMPHSNASCL